MDLINLAPPTPEYAGGTVNITTADAAQSGVFNAGAEGVIVWSDQDCYVLTANADNGAPAVFDPTKGIAMPARTPLALKVPSTTSKWVVGARAITTAGTLFYKPILRN